ncbi:MAG: phage holin family protein [Eubacteriales bacterium]|nr:phage holin family protein [Eubacteriales bacterium]
MQVCGITGIVGTSIVNLFGSWESDMTTLVTFMAIDFVMGLLIAGVFKKSNKSKSGALDSKASWQGLCKKCVTLLFVLIAYRLDLSLGTDYIKSAAIIAFIANEILSIVENAGLMGIKLPVVVSDAIEVLVRKGGDGK